MRLIFALSGLCALVAADIYDGGSGGAGGGGPSFTYCGGACTISIQEFPIYWANIEATTFTDIAAFSSYVDSVSAGAAAATGDADIFTLITPNEEPPPMTIKTDATGYTTLTCCDEVWLHTYVIDQDTTCGPEQSYVFAVPASVTGAAESSIDASILGTNPCKTLVETALPGPPQTKTYYPYLVGPTSTAAAASPAAASPSPNSPSEGGSGSAIPSDEGGTGSAIPSGNDEGGTGSAIPSGNAQPVGGGSAVPSGGESGTGSAIPSGNGEGTGSGIPSGSNEGGTGSAIPSGGSEGGTGSAIPSGSNEGGTGSAIPSGSSEGGTGSAIPSGGGEAPPAGNSPSPVPEAGTPSVPAVVPESPPSPAPETPSAPSPIPAPEVPTVPEANPGTNSSQPPQPSEVQSGGPRSVAKTSLLSGLGALLLSVLMTTVL